MKREGEKTKTGMGTEPLSQGLAEQAYVQTEALHQDLGEVGTAYSELNTGACATSPGLCAEHPETETGTKQTAGEKLEQKAREAADASRGTMQRWTSAFRNYSMDDLTQQVQAFARQHPALVIGGAVLAGFALTRALKITGNGWKTQRGSGRQPFYSEPLTGRDNLPGEEDVFFS
jgi:hypothetical protein